MTPDTLSWADFVMMLDREKFAGDSKRHRENAMRVYAKFTAVMKPQALADIDERTISQFGATLREANPPLKATTVSNYLTYMGIALRWAVEQRLLDRTIKIKRPKLAKGGQRRKVRLCAKLDDSAFQALLSYAPNDGWRLMLHLAWYAGMRRGECRRIKGEDVDLAAHTILIPQNKANDLDGNAIIPPELDKYFRERWPSGMIPRGLIVEGVPFSSSILSRTFKVKIAMPAKHEFGVTGSTEGGFVGMHDLRRAFASRWATKAPAQVLQRLCRHANIQTTLTFYADTEQAALSLLWPK